MIPEFIVKQKTHIIYGIILLIILGVGYNLLSSKPKEIIKTLTVTKEVVKNVVQTRTQFIDRKIEVKSKDGTDTITTEHIVNDSNTVSKTKLDETISKKEVEKFLSKYSLTVLYPLQLNDITSPYDYKKTEILGGIRVFDLPLFLEAGTNAKFDTVIVGLRVEF